MKVKAKKNFKCDGVSGFTDQELSSKDIEKLGKKIHDLECRGMIECSESEKPKKKTKKKAKKKISESMAESIDEKSEEKPEDSPNEEPKNNEEASE